MGGTGREEGPFPYSVEGRRSPRVARIRKEMMMGGLRDSCRASHTPPNPFSGLGVDAR